MTWLLRICKKQILMMLLVLYRYNLRDEEVSIVWRCLHDVLWTKKAHLANKQGQGLVIKQSICQVSITCNDPKVYGGAPFAHLSCVMRKPTFCICENKDADQLRGYLRGNREADQRLCFHYIDSTIPQLCKSEISSR